ncbi:LamG-like jellyroll fold domain-containing protein [Martelella sp. HB161492]|uniref:LamG-like jellyroll fold domain-containing protein n=1 Tax=Martelella sp. HB161492 TaxID=2720726 RepID=UPI001590AE98|nr:LamG-like jellyroll fold domain-containing protein [Martelella sp. HB161492]
MTVTHLILTIGNSHTIGRDDALSTDSFAAKVLQWTQAGVLSAPGAGGAAPGPAMLDHVNPYDGDFSPDLSFAEDYLAANPSVDRLVFVPHAEGATAFFSDTSERRWSVDALSSDNLLKQATDRFNAAHAALVSAGDTVVSAAILLHFANPDYDNAPLFSATPFTAHQEQIEAFVAYVRGGALTGVTSSTPVVIGGGMNEGEFDTIPVNQVLYQANLLGSHKRNDHVGTYDTINPRYGYSTGLPVPMVDSHHATRAGDITKGHLRFQALQRAAANSACHAPFSGLSFFSPATTTALWDFRTGTPLDISGNGNHLIRSTESNPPLYRVDPKTGTAPALDELAWTRTATSTHRVHQLPMALPAAYTIAVYQRFDQLTSAMAFLQKADGATASQHRFQFSASNNDVRAGHGSAADTVSFSAAGVLDTTSFHLLMLSFDGTTMRLYHNGTLKDQAASAAHASQAESYLGAATGTPGNPLIGTMAFAMVASRALTSIEVSELWTTAQSLLAP